MAFGIRLILAGIAALIAGGMFISESFEKPLEGMEPTPMWKGVMALVLGVGLFGFGVKYMLGERNTGSAETPPDSSE